MTGVHAWFGSYGCPNEPPCLHGGLFHDVAAAEGTAPICCVDGCTCGKPRTLVGAACALRACGDACLEPGCECECHEVPRTLPAQLAAVLKEPVIITVQGSAGSYPCLSGRRRADD